MCAHHLVPTSHRWVTTIRTRLRPGFSLEAASSNSGPSLSVTEIDRLRENPTFFSAWVRSSSSSGRQHWGQPIQRPAQNMPPHPVHKSVDWPGGPVTSTLHTPAEQNQSSVETCSPLVLAKLMPVQSGSLEQAFVQMVP